MFLDNFTFSCLRMYFQGNPMMFFSEEMCQTILGKLWTRTTAKNENKEWNLPCDLLLNAAPGLQHLPLAVLSQPLIFPHPHSLKCLLY